MEITSTQLFLIFIISNIIGIESILDQFQLHRPILASTLIGLILGNLPIGIMVGGTLEIMSLGWINIGAAVCPDTSLAAILSTIIVIIGKQNIGAGITLAIPIAAAGQILTIIVRSISISFQHWADSIIKNNDNIIYISYLHIIALLIQGLRISLPSMLFAYSFNTQTIQYLLNLVPTFITNGLNLSGNMMASIGYAMVINMIKEKHLMIFFFLGFIIASTSSLNLISLGILGIILAIIYIQLCPKYYYIPYKNINEKTSNNVIKDDELD